MTVAELTAEQVDNLVTPTEIARRTSYVRTNVPSWTRMKGFPEPVITRSKQNFYWWPDVKDWLVAHGRLKTEDQMSISRKAQAESRAASMLGFKVENGMVIHLPETKSSKVVRILDIHTQKMWNTIVGLIIEALERDTITLDADEDEGTPDDPAGS